MGFTEPEENWSKLPHEFISSMGAIASLAEMKVVLYVLRHTWGYHDRQGNRETEKRISLDEFCHGRKLKGGDRMDAGTGMSLNAVKDGIKRAIEDGYITIAWIDDSDKARVKTWYALAMRVSEVDPHLSKVDTQPSEVDPRSKKDTLETNLEKESTTSASKTDAPNLTPDQQFDSLNAVSDEEITQAKSAHRQMLSALSEVCQIDLSLCAGKYGKEASRLVKAGYTAPQVKEYYARGAEWYRYDWRGQKGQPPDIRAINETIQRAVSGAWKEGGGARENPGVAFAKRHGLMEDEHGDGRGSIEGVFTVSDDLSRSGAGERYRPGRNARSMADGVG